MKRGHHLSRTLSKAIALLTIVATLLFVSGGVVFATGGGQGGANLDDPHKTASATWTRTFQWTIAKTVNGGPSATLAEGGEANYQVTVTRDQGTDVFTVSGTITVKNKGNAATQNLAIQDCVYKWSGGSSIKCENVDVSANPVLDKNETGVYPYSFTFTPVPGVDNYKNKATVTITGDSEDDTAYFDLPKNPEKVNDTINVDDTNGQSWQFSAGGSKTYKKTFSCPGDEGQHNNTATIRETSQQASASVTVTCTPPPPSLQVTKDASTSLKRTYNWSISKDVDQSTWDLDTGQSGTSHYTVAVTKLGSTDSDWAVSGTINVHNGGANAASLTGVTDEVSGGIAANVNCGVTFPYQLAAGATLQCSYSANLPDGSARTNTAKATATNPAGGTLDFTGSAAVDFSSATVTEVNKSITVDDPNASPSEQGFSDSGNWQYDRTFTCDQDNGTHDNTATIRETGQQASASVSVSCSTPPSLEVTKTAETSLKRTYN